MCLLSSKKQCPECGTQRLDQAAKRQKLVEEVMAAHPFYTGTGDKPPGVNKKAAYNMRKAVEDITSSKEVGHDGFLPAAEVAASVGGCACM